jgi:formylglycine-generating enzyme required for sulfatase activity
MQAPTNMVFIPPGTFRMGSPTNEVDRFDQEGPQTAVTISLGFWMGKYEVTQGEYLAVMGNNPSGFTTNAYGNPIPPDLSRPVERVRWFDATNYCATLTQQERAAGRIPANNVYRLPTEAEWEYACRALTSTRFSYGDDPGHTVETNGGWLTVGYTNLTCYAWYEGNSDYLTHPVGQKLPNAWGLYDMHGNVWEWCQDWWSDRLPGGVVLDPQGPVTGERRVIRSDGWCAWGGFDAWGGLARGCRSAFRSSGLPTDAYWWFGFRVVLAPGQP